MYLLNKTPNKYLANNRKKEHLLSFRLIYNTCMLVAQLLRTCCTEAVLLATIHQNCLTNCAHINPRATSWSSADRRYVVLGVDTVDTYLRRYSWFFAAYLLAIQGPLTDCAPWVVFARPLLPRTVRVIWNLATNGAHPGKTGMQKNVLCLVSKCFCKHTK